MPIINLVKKLIATITGLLSYALFAIPAFAADPDPTSLDPCTNFTESGNKIGEAICNITTNMGQTITNLVIAIVVLAVIIALFYLLYGGIKWVTSRGDKTEVEGARNHITAAIVGLLIVFLAIFIITIVLSMFGIDLVDLKIPSIVTETTTPPVD